MFATTTVKLRISPVVGSHAITAGLSVSACTSVRTSVSLASSGGSVNRIALAAERRRRRDRGGGAAWRPLGRRAPAG